MKVVEIALKDDGGNINYLRWIMVDRRLGIMGENIENNKRIQISLLAERIRELIDDEEMEGLCLFRFYENITIRGLESDEISIGDILQIGETLQEVTSIGKRCFAECKLIQSGEKCDLFSNVIFTKVLKSGFVMIGDKVKLLK